MCFGLFFIFYVQVKLYGVFSTRLTYFTLHAHSLGLSVLLQVARVHSLFTYTVANIPLYIWNIFLHSFASRHLSCFNILAIINNAAMNIEVHLSFWIIVFLSSDKYPKVKLLGGTVVLFLIFWGVFVLFLIVAAPIYKSINNTQVPFSSCPHTKVC